MELFLCNIDMEDCIQCGIASKPAGWTQRIIVPCSEKAKAKEKTSLRIRKVPAEADHCLFQIFGRKTGENEISSENLGITLQEALVSISLSTVVQTKTNPF